MFVEWRQGPLSAHHGMIVDGENEVGVTRDRDEAESVANRLLDADDRKRGGGSTSIATESVDQCSIRCQDGLVFRRGVIPNTRLNPQINIADKALNIPITDGDYCAFLKDIATPHDLAQE